MIFQGFLIVVYFFELYMVPLVMLIVFLKNYVVLTIVGWSVYMRDEDEVSKRIFFSSTLIDRFRVLEKFIRVTFNRNMMKKMTTMMMTKKRYIILKSITESF